MIELRNFESGTLPRIGTRIKKYILVWCSEGEIDMEIDAIDFAIPANHIITITSGQFHKFKESSNAKGMMLQFTYDFFCRDNEDIELIFHNGLFCHFDRNEVINMTNRNSIGEQLRSIESELEYKPFQYLTSIHSRIQLLLIDINRAKIKDGGEIWKPEALFLRFLELVRLNFRHSEPVKYYADQLLTTELKLNELSKKHAGKTAQQIIHSLIASEAKRLFFYKNHSVKEVAFMLGFKDPFYFSNFFKRHTDLSPQSFKNQVAP